MLQILKIHQMHKNKVIYIGMNRSQATIHSIYYIYNVCLQEKS